MPIPFLLAGLGVAAGVIGAGGHLSAKEMNENAQKISQDAQDLYNNAKHSLEQAQNRTEKSLLKLGYSKKHVLDSSMNQFLSSYDKIKHITVTDSIGISEISKFTIDQQDAIELREMTDIYSSSIKSGATGAAAGAVVALAASGSLSLVGSEIALAGSFLAAGEIGAAAGIAGSALSFGAAMTPLAAVAAPVILFTGISASMKAEENLEKANTMYAEALAAIEKMKVSETLCDAITDKAEMFNNLLHELDEMFSECSSLLAGLIKKKEGKIFKKKLNSKDFSEEDLKLIAMTRALAGAVKAVIDTPILSNEGTISYQSEDLYNSTNSKLSDFSRSFEEIKQIDFKVKPINFKVNTNQSLNKSKNADSGTSILYKARNIFSFTLSLFFANSFSPEIAKTITSGMDKIFFIDSFVANKIAIWLIIFVSVTMIFGNLKNTKFEKWYGYAASVGILILYCEYCRTLEKMNHYIIFSIITLIIVSVLINFTEKIKYKISFGNYLYNINLCFLGYPILFFIYAFFSKLIGFSDGFCLVITSILMLLASFGIMDGTED